MYIYYIINYLYNLYNKRIINIYIYIYIYIYIFYNLILVFIYTCVLYIYLLESCAPSIGKRWYNISLELFRPSIQLLSISPTESNVI